MLQYIIIAFLDVSNNFQYFPKNDRNIVVIGSKFWISYDICPSFSIVDL